MGNEAVKMEVNPVSSRKIAVIGMGYVGAPLAVGLAKNFDVAVGFDVNAEKVEALKSGQDPTGEGLEEKLKDTTLKITADKNDLKGCDFFIVGVPTPIDVNKRPDLSPLRSACKTVGEALSPGSIVCFESTVYPGVTEDICGPILEEVSGLKQGKDFFLAYSPERINPGDKKHTLETITKVVSAENDEILEIVAAVYSSVVEAGCWNKVELSSFYSGTRWRALHRC